MIAVLPTRDRHDQLPIHRETIHAALGTGQVLHQEQRARTFAPHEQRARARVGARQGVGAEELGVGIVPLYERVKPQPEHGEHRLYTQARVPRPELGHRDVQLVRRSHHAPGWLGHRVTQVLVEGRLVVHQRERFGAPRDHEAGADRRELGAAPGEGDDVPARQERAHTPLRAHPEAPVDEAIGGETAWLQQRVIRYAKDGRMEPRVTREDPQGTAWVRAPEEPHRVVDVGEASAEPHEIRVRTAHARPAVLRSRPAPNISRKESNMALSLSKGQKISLEKTAGNTLTRVIMGLGWDAKKTAGFLGFFKQDQEIDLDATCVTFDAGGEVVDTVWFKQLQSKDGSIVHTGDNRTGAGDGDDEQIIVDLSKVPAHVQNLVFVVNSFTGQSFDQIQNAFCRLVDTKTEKEIARFQLSGGGGHTAQVMVRIYREGGAWQMHAIGEKSSGRTFQELLPAIKPHLSA